MAMGGRGAVTLPKQPHTASGTSPYTSASGDVIHVPISRPNLPPKVPIKEQIKGASQDDQLQAAINSIMPPTTPPHQPPMSPSPQPSPVNKTTIISTASKSLLQQLASATTTPGLHQPVTIIQPGQQQQLVSIIPQQQVQYHIQQPTTSFVLSNVALGNVINGGSNSATIINTSNRRKTGTSVVTASAVGSILQQPQQKNSIIFQSSSGSNRIILPNTFSSASTIINPCSNLTTNVPILTTTTNVPISPSTGNRLIRPNVTLAQQRVTSPLILANQKTVAASVRGGKNTTVNVYGGRLTTATNVQNVQNLLPGPTKIITNTGARVGGVSIRGGAIARGGGATNRGGTALGGTVTRVGGVMSRGGGIISRGGGVVTQRGGAMTRGGVMGARGTRGSGNSSNVRGITSPIVASNKRQLITVGGGSVGSIRGTNLVLAASVPISSSGTVDASTCTSPDTTIVFAAGQHQQQILQQQGQVMLQLPQQKQHQIMRVDSEQNKSGSSKQIIQEQQQYFALSSDVSKVSSVSDVTVAGIDDLHDYSFVEFPSSSTASGLAAINSDTKDSMAANTAGGITGNTGANIPGFISTVISSPVSKVVPFVSVVSGSTGTVNLSSSTLLAPSVVMNTSVSSVFGVPIASAGATRTIATTCGAPTASTVLQNAAATRTIATASTNKFIVSLQPNYNKDRLMTTTASSRSSYVTIGEKFNIVVDTSAQGSKNVKFSASNFSSADDKGSSTVAYCAKDSKGFKVKESVTEISSPDEVEILNELSSIGASEVHPKMIFTTTKGSHIKLVPAALATVTSVTGTIVSTPSPTDIVKLSANTNERPPQIIVSSKSGKGAFLKPSRSAIQTLPVTTSAESFVISSKSLLQPQKSIGLLPSTTQRISIGKNVKKYIGEPSTSSAQVVVGSMVQVPTVKPSVSQIISISGFNSPKHSAASSMTKLKGIGNLKSHPMQGSIPTVFGAVAPKYMESAGTDSPKPVESTNATLSASASNIMTVGASEVFASMKSSGPVNIAYKLTIPNRAPVSVVSVSTASAGVSVSDVGSSLSGLHPQHKLQSIDAISVQTAEETFPKHLGGSLSKIGSQVKSSAVHVISTSQAFVHDENSDSSGISNGKKEIDHQQTQPALSPGSRITNRVLVSASKAPLNLIQTSRGSLQRRGSLSEVVSRQQAKFTGIMGTEKVRKLSGNVHLSSPLPKVSTSSVKATETATQIEPKGSQNVVLQPSTSQVVVVESSEKLCVTSSSPALTKISLTEVIIKTVVSPTAVAAPANNEASTIVHKELKQRNSKDDSAHTIAIASKIAPLMSTTSLITEQTDAVTGTCQAVNIEDTENFANIDFIKSDKTMEQNENFVKEKPCEHNSSAKSPTISRSRLRKESSNNASTVSDVSQFSDNSKSHSLVPDLKVQSKDHDTFLNFGEQPKFISEDSPLNSDSNMITVEIDTNLTRSDVLGDNRQGKRSQESQQSCQTTPHKGRKERGVTSRLSSTADDSLRVTRLRSDSMQRLSTLATPRGGEEVEIKLDVSDDVKFHEEALSTVPRTPNSKGRRRVSVPRITDPRPRQFLKQKSSTVDEKACNSESSIITKETDLTSGNLTTSSHNLKCPSGQKQKTRASARLSVTPYEQAAHLRSGKKRTSM